MVENARELCGISGVEAALLLMERVYSTDTVIRIGGVVIDNIMDVEHNGDAYLVYTVAIEDHPEPFIFQFPPSFEPFCATAMDQDGHSICQSIEQFS